MRQAGICWFLHWKATVTELCRRVAEQRARGRYQTLCQCRYRVYPGEGVIDLPAILHVLRDGGYRGYLSLELFNPAYWREDPRHIARHGIDAVRRLVDSSGG